MSVSELHPFVWCYVPGAPNDFDECDPELGCKWFPGDDVIDWYSVDLFDDKSFSGPLTNANGKITSHGKNRRFLEMATLANKPVMIGEVSPSKIDITDDLDDGFADWDAWFDKFFSYMASDSNIRAFYYINYNWPESSQYLESGWKNANIATNDFILQKFKMELEKPKYLYAMELNKILGFAD